MIRLFLPLLLMLMICSSSDSMNQQQAATSQNRALAPAVQEEAMIGERIDGPANVRDKPNGEVIFELKDHVHVEATEIEGGWYQIMVMADIEYESDEIQKGSAIMYKGDTIGRALKSQAVSTVQYQTTALALLYGFTHEKNIKPGSIIEQDLFKALDDNGRDQANWSGFIHNWKLQEDAFTYKNYQTFYNYENAIEDPSPGFRIVLLFEDERLVGIFHSRELGFKDMKTYSLNRGFHVSLYTDYPESDQQAFVEHVNGWLNSVD